MPSPLARVITTFLGVHLGSWVLGGWHPTPSSSNPSLTHHTRGTPTPASMRSSQERGHYGTSHLPLMTTRQKPAVASAQPSRGAGLPPCRPRGYRGGGNAGEHFTIPEKAIPWDTGGLRGPSRVVTLLLQACTGTAFGDSPHFPAGSRGFRPCRNSMFPCSLLSSTNICRAGGESARKSP